MEKNVSEKYDMYDIIKFNFNFLLFLMHYLEKSIKLCRKIDIFKEIVRWRLKILREKQGEHE